VEYTRRSGIDDSFLLNTLHQDANPGNCIIPLIT
jgi:hypothetical protein